MDFYDRTYGFIHLPTLMIFVNPYSDSWDVAKFIHSGNYHDLDKYVTKLEASKSKDLIQRVTCFIHERKHFHDLLLTPYGNRIVRDSFANMIFSLAVLQEQDWDPGRSIEVPLQTKDVKDVKALDRVYRARKDYSQTIQSCLLTFEASATFIQLQHAWAEHGLNSTRAAGEDFSGNPLYSALINTFGMVASAKGIEEKTGKLFHQLILVALSEFVTNSHSISPDMFMTKVCEKMRGLPLKNATQVLEQILNKIAPGMRKNLKLTNSENDDFLKGAEQTLRKYTTSRLADNILAAFNDFREKSREFREVFLGDEECYIDPAKYISDNDNFVEPLFYAYSSKDEWLTDVPLDEPPDSTDLIVVSIYLDKKTGQKLYSYKLRPLKIFKYKKNLTEMNRKIWSDFAWGLGGCHALFEPVEWLHPLHGLWLKTYEDAVGIQFRRAGL